MHPALAAVGGGVLSQLYVQLFEKTPYMQPPQLNRGEREQVFASLGDMSSADTAVCTALISQGQINTVIFELMRLRAAVAALPILATRVTTVQAALERHGVTDITQRVHTIELEHYELMFKPNLAQILSSQGASGLVALYRKLVREKLPPDFVMPWGMSCKTSVDKIKEFCTSAGVKIAEQLHALARQEVTALIAHAHRTNNPSLHLRKALALLKIAEQQGVDTELDGNAGIKGQIVALEQALRKYPAN